MSAEQYEIAHAAAQESLRVVRGSTLQSALAEAVAACVVGKGGWGAARWERIVGDESFRMLVVRAVLRDLPATASTGPIEAAVTASAKSLLATAVVDRFNLDEGN